MSKVRQNGTIAVLDFEKEGGLRHPVRNVEKWMGRVSPLPFIKGRWLETSRRGGERRMDCLGILPIETPVMA